MWQLIYDQTLEAVPISEGSWYPIPDQFVENVNAANLIFEASSNSAQRWWYLGLRVTALDTFSLSGAESEVQIGFRKIPIGRKFYTSFKPAEMPYRLKLNIPFWFSQLSIKIWADVN